MKKHEYDNYYYEEGYLAYEAGRDIFDCPVVYENDYGESTAAYKSWMFGWNAAKQEALRKQAREEQQKLLEAVDRISEALLEIGKAASKAVDAIAIAFASLKDIQSETKEEK